MERSAAIKTFPTKTMFDLLFASPEDVHIEDLAWHLAHEGRYANGTREIVSVAQHSWHVSHLMPERIAGWGLFHDGSEAYLRDIPSPVKKLAFLSGYRQLEERVQALVYRAFGLSHIDIPPELGVADYQSYLYEDFLVRDAPDYPSHIVVPAVMSHAWTARMAEEMFLERHQELKEKGLVSR